jgi:lichenan operon transcriptional antiterminator
LDFRLDRDLDQLQAAISHSENSSRSETIQLFDRNHFYYFEHPSTKAELLNTIVGKLVEDKYAPEDFLASILEREEHGQTNLNNILAIPHPMSLMAFKSVVVPVAVIPDGIDWGDGHLVKFVFLFSITNQDYTNTEYIYDLLLELMDQTEKQERILSDPSFEHFMSVIENLTVVS